MILIAHRGNIEGPNPELENDPHYITDAIDRGYDVEIDLWYKHGQYALGHNEPQYPIHPAFLSLKGLWIHCKHYDSFKELSSTNLNFFYHTNEDYVLTGQRYIWAFIGKPGDRNTICVLPEVNNDSVEGFAGVCSDYIEKYKVDFKAQ